MKIMKPRTLLTLTLCIPLMANAKSVFPNKFFSTKATLDAPVTNQPDRWAKADIQVSVRKTITQPDGTRKRESVKVCDLMQTKVPVLDQKYYSATLLNFPQCNYLSSENINVRVYIVPQIFIRGTSADDPLKGKMRKNFMSTFMSLPVSVADKLEYFLKNNPLGGPEEFDKFIEENCSAEEKEQLKLFEDKTRFEVVSTRDTKVSNISFQVGSSQERQIDNVIFAEIEFFDEGAN